MATRTVSAPGALPYEQRGEIRRRPFSITRWLLFAGALLAAFVALYPFVWAVITSFKTQMEALNPTLIPFVQFTPTLEHWNQELGSGGQETFKGLRNSAIIATGATFVALTIGTMAGYGLARFRFKVGNRNIVSWFLSQRFLPPVATVIPYTLLMRQVGLVDTHIGMIMVNATFVLPFAVLILRDFFADFPAELEDAALVDGANSFQVFWRVALPIAGPAIVAAAIICFAFSWNEFLFASVLTNRDAQPFTLLVSGSGTVRGIHFGFVSTRLLLAIALPVILSLFVQRYIVRGLTLGAVKG